MNATPAPPFDPQIAVLPGGDPGGSQGAADRRRRRVRASRRAIALALTVALVALGSWIVTAHSTAAFRRLPPAERAALAERTLANLRDVCRRDDRPRDFCREQATLLLELPECGNACRAQARDELLADTAVR